MSAIRDIEEALNHLWDDRIQTEMSIGTIKNLAGLCNIPKVNEENASSVANLFQRFKYIRQVSSILQTVHTDLDTLYFLLYPSWIVSSYSAAYCQALLDDKLISRLCDLLPNLGKSTRTADAVLNIIQNVTENVDVITEPSRGAINQALLRFMNTSTDNLKTTCLIALANTLYYEDLNLICENHLLQFLFNKTILALKSSKKVANIGAAEFSCNTLLACLIKLARNDMVKEVIIQNRGVEIFYEALLKGETTEQELLSELLLLLSFCEKSKAIFESKRSLLQEINRLLKYAKSEKIKDNVEKLIWNLKLEPLDHLQQRQSTSHESESSPTISAIATPKLMLSYSWKPRNHADQVRSIAKDLQSLGYTVWLDVNDMRGSTLGCMAKAVEDSDAVLICMSELYQNSKNCRLEGEYAFQKDKVIIPLMMDNSFKPNGWLGALLGTKLYVKFDGKAPYDSSMQQLLSQIKVMLEDK